MGAGTRRVDVASPGPAETDLTMFEGTGVPMLAMLRLSLGSVPTGREAVGAASS